METEEVRTWENALCLKAAHRFCAFPPTHTQFKVVGSLSEASLLPVMTKD